MKLKDIQIKNAKPKEKAYKMADGGGLTLLIHPNGSKYWRLRYRYMNKEKTFAIGTYPIVSLLEAREERTKAKRLIKQGIDPVENRKQEQKETYLSAENTFETIALEWHENKKSQWSENHAKDILNRLSSDIFPEIGNRPIKDITPPDVLDALRKIEKRGAHEIARRLLQNCSQVFRYGVATGKLESDPTRDLKGALKPYKKGHYNALDVKELPEFLHVLNTNEARLYPQTIRAVKLLMLTFVRTGELIGAQWCEFDFDTKQWNIPAERMKMKKPHVVPLSKQVIALLEEQKEMTGQWEWVFPNQVRPKKHMSNNTVLMALRRMGYQGRMTGHGFRALAMSTIKQELGYRHEVVDRQLAHAPKNLVDAAYDRAAFLEERTKMMQDWPDYLDDIIKHNDQIVSINKTKNGVNA